MTFQKFLVIFFLLVTCGITWVALHRIFYQPPPIKIDQVEKPADSIKVQPPTPIPRATKFKTFLVQQSPEFPVTHTPATTIAQVTNDYHEGEIFVTKDQFEIIDDSSIVILKLDEEQTLRAMLLARSD